MNLQVIVLDDAEEELDDAESWYESQRPGLGPIFLSAVSAATAKITAYPEAAGIAPGTPVEFGARAVRVRTFPFSVVFRRVGDVFWVIAFAHHKRRPGYWRDRVPTGG